MPAYYFTYTQKKIKEIPNELINDIIKLTKNIFGKNKFNKIYKVDKRISYFNNTYDDVYIVRLNNKKIYIRIYCGWFIIDTNKSGIMDCEPDDEYYEVFTHCLIMLCIYYNLVGNNWSNDNNKLDKNVITKCKKELYKLGFKQIVCNFNTKLKYYYLTKMIK